jgi:hypothetical protein
MGRWRRQQGGIHHQEAQGARSQSRKPPLGGMYAFWLLLILNINTNKFSFMDFCFKKLGFS